MTQYQIKLTHRKEIATGTMAFYFEKPKSFVYKGGQSVDMTLIDPPETDSEGNIRPFTIASAPHEPELMIATRMRDTAFKRVLGKMTLGGIVGIDGPFGSFTLHNAVAKPAVFLMGGIGITPARAMIADAMQRKLSHELILFYSNRTPQDAAFLDELEAFAKLNPRFTLVPIMTKTQGHMSMDLLKKYIDDLAKPIYYTAGPPAMVAATRKLLNDGGIDDDSIRSEDFSGY